MTTARKLLVDPTVTRYYHCISRCVRRAFLCGQGFEHRKQWIEDRLELLAGNFAISIAGFAVLDNHLHLLCRLDVEEANVWTDEEVVRRWVAVYPPATLALDDEKVVRMWVQNKLGDKQLVAAYRERLQSLGWFMKSLKEPLARMANREDQCKGTFWEARYKSIAILDEEALLATCAYIDLNPLAAGAAETPESSLHTSIRQRVAHVRDQGKLDCLKAARAGSVAGSRAAGNIEQGHWLVPIEDRRGRPGVKSKSSREGLLDTFSLGSYLLLVEYTGRLFRNGKARMSSGVKQLFERLGTSEQVWGSRLRQMLKSSDLRGSYFATDRSRIQQLAEQRGQRHLANLSPQVAA